MDVVNLVISIFSFEEAIFENGLKNGPGLEVRPHGERLVK